MRALMLAGTCLLAACAHTGTQAAYTAEQAYTTAAHTEVVVAPLLTAAQVATMQHLDQQAYQEVVSLRTAAQAGTDTSVYVQGGADAIGALTTFLKQHGG